MALANKPSCSFCGKNQTQVSKLIAGQNDTYICNDCVDVCTQVLAPASTNIGKPHFEIIEQQMFCALLYNYDWTIIDKMKAWLKENDIRIWTSSSTVEEDVFKIIFENESDLVAFKLRWI